MTKYSADVDTANVLPEYPRPQMVRSQWMNLNGLWQYKTGTWQNEPYPKRDFNKTILVPFAVESALSGIMEHHDRIWYRRKFTIPADWQNKRILLHFGAVDYECEVFINNKSAGKHQGGYDPFTIDITDLISTGEQTVTVKVWDPTDGEGFPRGKQTLNPQGIMYTSVTGIWQTVWLEPVEQSHIIDFKMTPDIDKSLLNLSLNVSNGSHLTYTALVKDGDKVVATMKGGATTPAAIKISKPKLWSPDHPFLYDMTITLQDGDKKVVDQVKTYFGMRKTSVGFDGQYRRLYLNNKFLFQLGPLDQGFWPDGLYTAPTDAALRSDLEMIKKLGFNMVRKHIKVEPQRWYYWCDKMGLMVWQDMPSPNSYTFGTPPPDKEAFTNELIRMVETHYNAPSIVTWVLFNEGQAQHDTKKYVALIKGLDPSRIVNEASGWKNEGAGDISDVHAYPPPACPESATQATACGEFGGIGYQLDQHVWNNKDLMQYVTLNNEKDYLKLFDNFSTMLAKFKTNKGLSAAVFTEITDVEIELNGIMTYDRVLKVDPVKIRQSNLKAIGQDIYEQVNNVLPTAENAAVKWQYTTAAPGEKWMDKAFNASSWQTANGGFGTRETPGARVGTAWNTHDIWIRQVFDLEKISAADINQLMLRVHHDEDCEVYINGMLVASLPGWTSDYENLALSELAKESIKRNQQNVIAIHCVNKTGGQFIDAGLTIISNKK
ncbi:MAG: sugar-binding domain-containing protein [Mucilaginibacter sp.]